MRISKNWNSKSFTILNSKFRRNEKAKKRKNKEPVSDDDTEKEIEEYVTFFGD